MFRKRNKTTISLKKRKKKKKRKKESGVRSLYFKSGIIHVQNSWVGELLKRILAIQKQKTTNASDYKAGTQSVTIWVLSRVIQYYAKSEDNFKMATNIKWTTPGISNLCNNINKNKFTYLVLC
jgi:hypothetical protein